jgi:phosphatidate cytidylyltransferase
MRTFLTRLFSAVFALVIFFYVFYAFKENGVRALCFLASALGAREVSRILFVRNDNLFLKAAFFVSVLINFIFTAFYEDYHLIAFACVAIFLLSASLLLESTFKELEDLTFFQSKSVLGVLYVGTLPGFAAQTVDRPQGLYWFLTLLAVVFIGDTFAYIFGLLLGKKKIFPRISPKKTVIGAFGGLVGSVAAALFCSQWFNYPVWIFALIGLLGGLVAQLGDLFESLLKRVANVKDSGSIMPGHGGLLDRIDGVLFAAPVLVVFSTFLTQFY